MKVSQRQLKQIIKEEVKAALLEDESGAQWANRGCDKQRDMRSLRSLASERPELQRSINDVYRAAADMSDDDYYNAFCKPLKLSTNVSFADRLRKMTRQTDREIDKLFKNQVYLGWHFVAARAWTSAACSKCSYGIQNGKPVKYKPGKGNELIPVKINRTQGNQIIKAMRAMENNKDPNFQRCRRLFGVIDNPAQWKACMQNPNWQR
jgi:hypothetical protein